jgi:16S rRNA (uracil1498-N3)-methyltransferase
LTSTHFFIDQKNLIFPHAWLEGPEHHHLSRVLRAKKGKKVWLVDERGNRYLAEVEAVEQDRTRLLLIEKRDHEPAAIRISLAQASLKSKKMDSLIQKATELGITAFIPVETERSIVKIKEREAGKIERWRKIAHEAAKQSRRSLLPDIHPPRPFSAVLSESKDSRRFILTEDRGTYLREVLTNPLGNRGFGPAPSVLLLVGPEGGWAAAEVKAAHDHGFESVSLGQRVLRAETAALAALALISHFWGD